MNLQLTAVEAETFRRMTSIRNQMLEVIFIVQEAQHTQPPQVVQRIIDSFYEEMLHLRDLGFQIQNGCDHRVTNRLLESLQDDSFLVTTRCQCCYKEIK